MKITLTNILYLWKSEVIYNDDNVVKEIMRLEGYRVSFLINEDIKSTIEIKTYDEELNIEGIKERIEESLKGEITT